jgi:plasmid stability protein
LRFVISKDWKRALRKLPKVGTFDEPPGRLTRRFQNGSIIRMSTITIKGVPSAVHRRMKMQAARNHRSLNQEIIGCMSQKVVGAPENPAAWLAEAQAVREMLKDVFLTPAALRRAREDGRP